MTLDLSGHQMVLHAGGVSCTYGAIGSTVRRRCIRTKHLGLVMNGGWRRYCRYPSCTCKN